jgi:hypothetical protein
MDENIGTPALKIPRVYFIRLETYTDARVDEFRRFLCRVRGV